MLKQIRLIDFKSFRRLGSRWQGVLQVCPELADLKQRIATWLSDNAEDGAG